MHTHHPHHHQQHQQAQAHGVTTKSLEIHGWRIIAKKGPIISDKDTDDYRAAVGESVRTLPEMLFNTSRLTLVHAASGVALDFNALDALRQWHAEGLPPLQVKVAQEWRKAREHEISQQKAVQLEYDWTYTTPYQGTVTSAEQAAQPAGPPYTPAAAAAQPAAAAAAAADGASSSGSGVPAAAPAAAPGAAGSGPDAAAAPAAGPATLPEWEETSDQIDRGLLMERDPILFFDEVSLYESDLDDNGVCEVSVKLRAMPRCWLVLLRCWIRVDGCMARLRETRLFCRHDLPGAPPTVIRETKWCEGSFKELRAAGAPADGPAYADADSASQAFQAVAPIGLKQMKLHKLVLPVSNGL